MEIVSVADLKIGMFVAEPDCSWNEFSFAFQGFVLSTPDQVDIFQQKCRFVYIDRSRSLNEHYAAPKPGFDRALKSSPYQSSHTENVRGGSTLFTLSEQDRREGRRRRFLDFLHSQKDNEHAQALSRELGYIEPRYDELTHALQHAFQAFSEGREVKIHTVREGLRDITSSLQRNADAVMWLLRLKRRDQYSFDHAMDVSVNMILLGSHIGWREQRLVELGLAGMMQDIGKIELPVELLAKKDTLSAEERELIRSHVASSLEILYSKVDVPQEVIVTVSRHHERWDGSGYPRGLRFEEIGMAAEIAGIADSFCAMLKDKPYRNALGYQAALEELHNQRGKQFNPALMEQFVQCVGLYPSGTLVELNTGEVGVVIQQNRVQRAKPRLLMMLDANKEPVTSYRIVELRDEANARLRIAKALPNNAYGLAANDYYLG
ncbi:MAG: HD-GYP domain-containing protein [Azonexus sp.]|jgi:HD-GYP domain-containing protein (c-di-GMP phosphodiesterase class II)|nr:HD-GYP domain-containing protein [Azonexus sp.]